MNSIIDLCKLMRSIVTQYVVRDQPVKNTKTIDDG